MENAQESKYLLPPVGLGVTMIALFQEVGSPRTAEYLIKVWTGGLGKEGRWWGEETGSDTHGAVDVRHPLDTHQAILGQGYE